MYGDEGFEWMPRETLCATETERPQKVSVNSSRCEAPRGPDLRIREGRADDPPIPALADSVKNSALGATYSLFQIKFYEGPP